MILHYHTDMIAHKKMDAITRYIAHNQSDMISNYKTDIIAHIPKKVIAK